MSSEHKRSLRNYLLDSSYQLRFTSIIVVISGVLTTGLGWLVMRSAREASRVVQVRALDPTDELAQQLVAEFARGDRILLLTLVSFGVLLSLVLAAYGIVVTHKVAGPLHKITSHLDDIRDGKLGTLRNLRRGDELVDFFGHFKAAHDALRRRTQEDIALLDRAIAATSSNLLADELRAAKERKERSLE